MSQRHHQRTRRRFLSMETLEGRRLLITGTITPDVLPQNFANPEDTNDDGAVSPGDALIVINELNRAEPSGSPRLYSADVDGDGVVSPRDALLVINRLNSGSNTSSVAPEQRAIGLRKALDAGYVPPKMSLPQAQELLDTLEKGGHYEAGERYRNGQMININDPPKALDGPAVAAEAESLNSIPQPAGAASEDLLTETASLETGEETDSLALLESADKALSKPLYDPTLWQASVDITYPAGTAAADRFSAELAEQLSTRLATKEARVQLAQAIADAVKSGDQTSIDLIAEVEALRATLGDIHSQIAQLFAQMDIQGIIEQLGVDLGTLAEAILSDDAYPHSLHHEALVAEFFSSDYFVSFGEALP
ncbi:MAG: dockerin type I domain-containing protein [Planctomycetota bacterium]